MPDRVLSMFEQILLLIAIGAAVPIGRGLMDTNRIGWRVIAGRVIINVVFTLSAGAVLVWVPGVPQCGLLGVAAVLSSLGQSGIERWAQRYRDRMKG